MLDVIILCLFLLEWYFLLEFLIKGTDNRKRSELLFSLVKAILCTFSAFLLLFLK